MPEITGTPAVVLSSLDQCVFFHASSQVSFIYVAQHHRSDKKKHFFSSIFLRLSKRLESQEYSIFQSCPPSTFKQMRCILYTFSYKHNPPKGALSPSNTNTVAISSKIQQVLTGCSLSTCKTTCVSHQSCLHTHTHAGWTPASILTQ